MKYQTLFNMLTDTQDAKGIAVLLLHIHAQVNNLPK